MLVGNEASLYKVQRTSDIDLSCPILAAKWEEFRNGRCHFTSDSNALFHCCIIDISNSNLGSSDVTHSESLSLSLSDTSLSFIGDLRWLACTYSNPKVISYLQSDHSEQLDSLQTLLEESENRVIYGVFSVKISGILRWVFYSFIGDRVGGMHRATNLELVITLQVSSVPYHYQNPTTFKKRIL